MLGRTIASICIGSALVSGCGPEVKFPSIRDAYIGSLHAITPRTNVTVGDEWNQGIGPATGRRHSAIKRTVEGQQSQVAYVHSTGVKGDIAAVFSQVVKFALGINYSEYGNFTAKDVYYEYVPPTQQPKNSLIIAIALKGKIQYVTTREIAAKIKAEAFPNSGEEKKSITIDSITPGSSKIEKDACKRLWNENKSAFGTFKLGMSFEPSLCSKLTLGDDKVPMVFAIGLRQSSDWSPYGQRCVGNLYTNEYRNQWRQTVPKVCGLAFNVERLSQPPTTSDQSKYINKLPSELSQCRWKLEIRDAYPATAEEKQGELYGTIIVCGVQPNRNVVTFFYRPSGVRSRDEKLTQLTISDIQINPVDQRSAKWKFKKEPIHMTLKSVKPEADFWIDKKPAKKKGS